VRAMLILKDGSSFRVPNSFHEKADEGQVLFAFPSSFFPWIVPTFSRAASVAFLIRTLS
jgi:hypothetical protein